MPLYAEKRLYRKGASTYAARGIAARRAARGKFFGAGAEAGFAADRPGHYEQRGAARDVRESGARFQRKNRNRLEEARRATGRTTRSRTPRNRLSRARRGFERIAPRQEHGPFEAPPAVAKRVATAPARAFTAPYLRPKRSVKLGEPSEFWILGSAHA
jgi:hypothetical protein